MTLQRKYYKYKWATTTMNKFDSSDCNRGGCAGNGWLEPWAYFTTATGSKPSDQTAADQRVFMANLPLVNVNNSNANVTQELIDTVKAELRQVLKDYDYKSGYVNDRSWNDYCHG